MIEYGEVLHDRQYFDNPSASKSHQWCREYSKPQDYYYCTRPKGHAGGHETASVGSPDATASWYTDSSDV